MDILIDILIFRLILIRHGFYFNGAVKTIFILLKIAKIIQKLRSRSAKLRSVET